MRRPLFQSPRNCHTRWGGRLLLVWIWFVVLLASSLEAHQSSDSYLTLTVTNQTILGRLDLSIRDLDGVFELDDDVNGTVTWGEVKAHRAEIAQYVTTNLVLRVNDLTKPLGDLDLLIDEHGGAGFTVWRFQVAIPKALRSVEVTYRCLFEIDALHRGFMKIEKDGKSTTGMFSPASPTQRFNFEAPMPVAANWKDFVKEGIWHIWTGYDHVLFLLALLLPAVVRRIGARWEAVSDLRPALWRVLQTVTAFTLAHSITLTLAALGWVHLSPRIVEPIIAASVVLAAMNNLRPFFHERGWMVAFGFGLIHGFGFASVLQEMDLEGGSLAWPLIGFNLGVEVGQAAIVACFVPVAFALRNTRFYQWGALRFGSAAIVILAGAWFVERIVSGP